MSARVPWVLGSRNPGKLRELRALFATHGIDVVDLRDVGVTEDVDAEEEIEAFETFAENALAKARYFSSRLPGRIVVADDSGLAVRALGDAPGVRSKRWSAETGLTGKALERANNEKLVHALAGMPDRAAKFVCAAAWVDGSREFVQLGEVHGRVVDEPLGIHGFGYDPHVFVDELGKTMAEASIVEKEVVSHRGRAFVSLLGEVRSRGVV